MALQLPPELITFHPSVEEALSQGRPVVALESTVITHGLPRPTNLETARAMEETIRAAGAVPATVALLEGRLHLGLEEDELEWLALEAEAVKVSRRDFGPALARKQAGGTTVAGTMIAAHHAGIRVFATGGIGGVHRGDLGDISTDLTELARTPVAVVCAGAKSILDLPRTLELIETLGVPVIGWGTETFPAFFSRSSGLPVSASAANGAEIASYLKAQWQLGLEMGALVTVPVPRASAVDQELISTALAQAESEADQRGIRGQALTPFLLSRLADLTEGASLRANLALLEQNARRAAELALNLLSK
ncbi:MAG: pseudouridine-5'-phosphate glycosidase [Anaerolineales bacterium]